MANTPPGQSTRISSLLHDFLPPLASYYDLYRSLHANPELSGLEAQTAASIVTHLRQFSDFVIHEKIGGHGVAAVLANGVGKTVLLRADMDGLPVEEKTDLPYASRKVMLDGNASSKPVTHACGHDVHITTLLASAHTLYTSRHLWSGTLICVFQPSEEDGKGAEAMVEDGLYARVNHVPDILFAAHVVPAPAGFIGVRKGAMTSNSDSFHITVYGRGGHASLPEVAIDPVVLVAHIVVRLQTIVSREVAGKDSVVLTIGSLHAGSSDNVIPSEANISVNIRTFDHDVREKVIASIKRIVNAECLASGSPKEAVFEHKMGLPLTWNDETATEEVVQNFQGFFRRENVASDIDPIPGSEDFSHLATAISKPCVYWVYGFADHSLFTFKPGQSTPVPKSPIPSNHSPFFAPNIENTLKIAVESYVVAALTWLL